MIRIFERRAKAFFLAAFLVASSAFAAEGDQAPLGNEKTPSTSSLHPPLPTPPVPRGVHRFVAVKLEGLHRTDPAWLTSYLDLDLPAELDEEALYALQRKLLTTGIFWSVALDAEPSTPAGSLLVVRVDEKWTLIPVIRAAYGGGTPLRVLGAYDINVLGRLLTLGGEARKYGDAPPGYVLYFRDPRGDSDRHYFGAELWREFRRRDLYDGGSTPIGEVATAMTMARLRLLVPIGNRRAGGRRSVSAYPWKVGGDVEALEEAPDTFDPATPTSPGPPPTLGLNLHSLRQVKVLPSALYDDVQVDNLEYEGVRSKVRAGPVFVEGQSRPSFAGELETYAYLMLPLRLNVASRVFVGETTYNTVQNNYFLGGLDTIRGLPDGAIYGTHAAYGNLEVRQVAAKLHYLWVQPAVFVDAGSAADEWRGLGESARATAGLGVRLAVPQVYRLVLRVDYAWSIDGKSHSQGVTAGLNQFFDPYVPL